MKSLDTASQFSWYPGRRSTPARRACVICMLAAFALLRFVPGAVAEDADSKVDRPLEPQVADASSEGTEAMTSFKLPDGWGIELFAAEPDVANIVAFDVDNLGRVFVCESFRQNKGVTDNREHDDKWLRRDLAAQTVQDRIDYHRELLGDAVITYTQQDDRIRLLVDTDKDGKADVSTIYASGFNQIEDGSAAGVLARGKHVYLTNIPKLYDLVDSDGDGIADERIVLSDGYGVRVAFRGHDMHGLVMGPDGRLYFSIGDRGYHVLTTEGKLLHDATSGAIFRCELDGSGLEVFATGLRNPQELAFNDYGDLFTGDNNSDSGDKARIVHLLRGGDTGWRMYYQYLPDRGPFNQEKIWEPFHDQQPAYIVPPITNFGDGPSGLTYYPGTGFGDELNDTFLLADFRGGPTNSGIRSFQLSPEGAFYKLSEDSQKVWGVLATDVAFGPDGALYISDWVNGWNGEGKGRLYRLTKPESNNTELVRETANLLSSDWTKLDTDRLAKLLQHTDRRLRYEAQWELANRQDRRVFHDLARNLDATTIPRLHALWGLEEINRQSKSLNIATIQLVTELLEDEDDYVRSLAAKIAGQNEAFHAGDMLVSMLEDPSSRVRYFAAQSLGDCEWSNGFDAVVSMLSENDNRDPALRHAGIMALSKLASGDKLVSLSNASSANVRRAAVVALRRQGDSRVQRFLADGDTRVVAEAARAIYDTEILDGLPALAALLDRPLEDWSVIRRALNANFRLGTRESAMALAAYAGRESGPELLRLEALAMLGNWASPDERDRLLNDWRPLPERDAADAASALRANLPTILAGSEDLRSAAITLAAELGLEEISPLLVTRLDDESLSPKARATALQAMAKLEPSVATVRAEAMLADLSTLEDLRVAAVDVLSAVVPNQSLKFFIASTSGELSVAEQQAAWDALGKVADPEAIERINEGVQLWLAGKLDNGTALNVIEAARATSDSELVQKVKSALEANASEQPLNAYAAMLDGGNADNGEVLFYTRTELSCVRCHKVGSQGGEVGPDLTAIAKDKDARYLLEAIVYPDAQIAKGYETTVLADDFGTVHSGIVKIENDETIELIKADGSLVRLFKDEIIARRRGQSAMPADLIKYMSERELRDLVAFLKTLDTQGTSSEGSHGNEG